MSRDLLLHFVEDPRGNGLTVLNGYGTVLNGTGTVSRTEKETTKVA